MNRNETTDFDRGLPRLCPDIYPVFQTNSHPSSQFRNLKFAQRRPTRDLAGMGWFRVAWGRDAEAETARETENLVAWGGRISAIQFSEIERPGNCDEQQNTSPASKLFLS
jgi:hypothetical protein